MTDPYPSASRWLYRDGIFRRRSRAVDGIRESEKAFISSVE